VYLGNRLQTAVNNLKGKPNGSGGSTTEHHSASVGSNPLPNLQPTTSEASPDSKPTGGLKPIAYKPNSFHLTNAPKEPLSTETFYVIQRKNDPDNPGIRPNASAYLCRHDSWDGEHFSKAPDELNLRDVRRFAKPFDYSCLYYVPIGKRKEIELDRSEWRWVKVSIKMEAVDKPKGKSEAA